jgi:arylformamidase
MPIIDLSQPIEDGMPVYPGDPAVRVQVAHTYEREGWLLRDLRMGSHTGTHVDAIAHMHPDGPTLDDLPLSRFCGPAVVRVVGEEFPNSHGVLFRAGDLTTAHLPALQAARVPFVGLGDSATMSVETERALLGANILTYTGLVNLDQLPSTIAFTFYGLPLKIRNGDGSPVRAIAVLPPA